MKYVNNLFFLFIFVSITLCGQIGNHIERPFKRKFKYFVSPSIHYNVAIKEPGLGFSYGVEWNQRITLGTTISYFPGLFEVKDLYAGFYGKYIILKSERKLTKRFGLYDANVPEIYAIGSFENNWWLNKNTQNLTPFMGLGVSRGKSYYKYFVEAKYNIVYNEVWAKVGAQIQIMEYLKFRKNKKLILPK